MNYRDIDTLVAERVMGYEVGRDRQEDIPVIVVGNCLDYLPRYSADITAAWKVWEHLRASSEYCCMELGSPISEGFEVTLRRVGHDEDHDRWFVRVEHIHSAPLAICLAALATVGIHIAPKDLDRPLQP